jgi:hypothetical protein
MNGWIEPPSLGAQGVLFMPLGSLGAYPPPWAPKVFYLCPWGALGRAPTCLARDLPWGRSELCFHKLSIVQIFLIQPFLVGAISLTSELQTMQIWCPGCVPTNYIQLWYTLVSLKTKIRSPKQPWKIICLISDLSAQLAFRGAISPISLSLIGPSTCPSQSCRRDAQLWYSNFWH